MVTAAAWALIFSLMTVIPDESLTLALSNIFWTLILIAAVSLFLLSYEFVHKTTMPRFGVLILFSPAVAFFVLSWFNPGNLIYTTEYTVTSDGFLDFPVFGGLLRVLLIQVYGYLLVLFAAGMFIGEAIRTDGIQQRQTLYLLLIFSVLVISTVVKVIEIIPVYYDITSTAYGFTGLLFAYSIHKHGLLRTIPTARTQIFDEINDAILVLNEHGTILDANTSAETLFYTPLVGDTIETLLPEHWSENSLPEQIEIQNGADTKHFTVQTTDIQYGRKCKATIVTLNNITELKTQEKELTLLKKVLSRMFRHNIRNHLTVMNAYTTQLINTGDKSTVDTAKDIQDIALHIEAQTEKAREIENIITNDTHVNRSLSKFLGKADFTTIPGYDTANIQIDIGEETVHAHPEFHLAIQELVENALTHDVTGEQTTVKIRSEATENTVTLIVQDNGPGLPEHEIEVLKNQEETSLKHGSGIGLWLVYWIVNYSNGELNIEKTESGTLIKIRLNRLDTAHESDH